MLPKELALQIIPLLRSEKQILEIMKKAGYSSDVCKASIPLLKLKDKSEEEIHEVMAKTNYNHDVCEAGIVFMKSENRILDIMEKLIITEVFVR
jgi:hypothetical protein